MEAEEYYSLWMSAPLCPSQSSTGKETGNDNNIPKLEPHLFPFEAQALVLLMSCGGLDLLWCAEISQMISLIASEREKLMRLFQSSLSVSAENPLQVYTLKKNSTFLTFFCRSPFNGTKSQLPSFSTCCAKNGEYFLHHDYVFALAGYELPRPPPNFLISKTNKTKRKVSVFSCDGIDGGANMLRALCRYYFWVAAFGDWGHILANLYAQEEVVLREFFDELHLILPRNGKESDDDDDDVLSSRWMSCLNAAILSGACYGGNGHLFIHRMFFSSRILSGKTEVQRHWESMQNNADQIGVASGTSSLILHAAMKELGRGKFSPYFLDPLFAAVSGRDLTLRIFEYLLRVRGVLTTKEMFEKKLEEKKRRERRPAQTFNILETRKNETSDDAEKDEDALETIFSVEKSLSMGNFTILHALVIYRQDEILKFVLQVLKPGLDRLILVDPESSSRNNESDRINDQRQLHRLDPIPASSSRGCSFVDEGRVLVDRVSQGVTPLYIAAEMGSIRCMRLLIKAGANVNTMDKSGTSLLAVLINAIALRREKGSNMVRSVAVSASLQKQDVRKAPRTCNASSSSDIKEENDLMRILVDILQSNPDFNMQSLNERYQLLSGGSGGEIERGADLRKRKKNGSSSSTCPVKAKHPIFAAVSHQLPDIVELLLSCGADVNARDPVQGVTPLHIAAMRGYTCIVHSLCDHDALLEVKDKDQMTPLLRAILSEQCDIALLLIHYVNQRKEKNIVGEKEESNVQQQQVVTKKKESMMTTPLLEATRRRMLAVVTALLESGADPNEGGGKQSNEMALTIARRKEDKVLQNVLCKFGAKQH